MHTYLVSQRAQREAHEADASECSAGRAVGDGILRQAACTLLVCSARYARVCRLRQRVAMSSSSSLVSRYLPYMEVVVLAPMHMHMSMHSRSSSCSLRLCALSTIRVIRLPTVYRIALPGGWRVREAICAGGLVRDSRYEQVLTER
jgi:hypothetical protein